MTELDIETTLEVALNEVAEQQSLTVVYPNIGYEPEVGMAYIRTALVPAAQSSVGIGTHTRNRHIGFYQLTVNVPSFETKGPLQNIIDALHEKFKRGTTLVHNDVYVRVTRFRVVNYVEGPDWFTQFIRIEYRADLEN